MTQDFPTDVERQMTDLIEQCDTLIEAHDAELRRLRESMADVERERASVIEARTEAHHVLDTLKSAQAQAQKLYASSGEWALPGLRVMQGDGTGLEVSAGQAHTVGQAAATRDVAEELKIPAVVRGERSMRIMDVIRSDPRRHWTTTDIAAKLGETSPAGMKRMRAGLDHLRDKGVLLKTSATDTSPVTYHLITKGKACP